jgi:hypothetical protein
MRQVLRFLLGNRYGAALALIAVIAAVVAVGKLVGHPAANHPALNPDAVAPAVSASTSQEPDDGMDQPSEAPLAPSTSPGAAPPQTVAVDFARAWLNHTNISATDWHKAVAKYATKSLADRLDGTDPITVPASQMTGTPTFVTQLPAYADIAIPLDAGTLTLTLSATNGRWLVDGVDWERT